MDRTEHSDEAANAMPQEPACMPIVSLEPAWEHWESALATESKSDQQREMRSALGLDAQRPVVMSGHQPIVFHCGILAKLIALDEAAKKTDSQAVWIIPDQDTVDPGRIRVPVGSRGSLRVEYVQLVSEGSIQPGASACSIPAMEVESTSHRAIEPLAQWIDQYATMESLAQQFGYATIEYACELLGIEPPRLIFASELIETQQYASWVDAMIQDPGLCAQAYNNAAQKYPGAKVRTLKIEDDRIELPLWGCQSGHERVAVDTQNINSFDRSELMPRGLMMSAVARAFLADLFIHGVGGYSYDRVSEEWIRRWMGIELKPMAMVTATHRLDLGYSSDELQSRAVDPSKALWSLHHARHHPAMVGETALQQRRDEMVKQISTLGRKDSQRRKIYASLQRLLEDYRQTHADQIGEYQIKASNAIKLADQYRLALDRTWAYVLFDIDQLRSLDRATRERLSGYALGHD